MSTFKGVVAEFPQIRIDFFRTSQHHSPPLACFLSHVHSDHLQGLESLKSPFVYCSAATRELLLRLEKYPHRMNFAKGLLESRKQHYKHLASLLKPIPLNAPTVIELSPGLELRVTLFDANHCAGAVMFLIQGQGNAILYTGDIRSEPWWVNALVRNPVLVPYTIGKLRLDKIYLDTTFAVNSDPYRRFPSKAEGLRELLEKVALYPDDTIFHFNAWTLGYEDVWIALSALLGSQVHVDRYKMRLYKSITSNLENSVTCHEGPPLCGFKFGNRHQPGCLTTDRTTRLHSCERGTACSVFESNDVVTITPIITRLSKGGELPEIGAGGGGGDLNESHELELNDAGAVGMLIKLCRDKVQDPTIFAKICSLISTAMVSDRQMLSLDALALDEGSDAIKLSDLAELLIKIAADKENQGTAQGKASSSQRHLQPKLGGDDSSTLRRTITFPYSRHSSYEELCLLVDAFKPRDLYPCTTDEESWHQGLSMKTLFGHLCSGETFAHDREMIIAKEERTLNQRRKQRDGVDLDNQRVSSSQSSSGTDRSNGVSFEEMVEATVAQKEMESQEDEGAGETLPRHAAKKSKTSHQGVTAEEDSSQLDCIDAVARGFDKQSASNRPSSRQEEAREVQSRDSLTFKDSSATGSKNIRQVQKQRLTGRRDSSKTTRPQKQSTTNTAPSSTASSVSFKTFKCHWLDCSERFTTLDDLVSHLSERHCVEIPISASSFVGCLWRDCTRRFPLIELWKSHVFKDHICHELSSPLRSSNNTTESRSSSSLFTPQEEQRLLSTNSRVEDQIQQQPPSATSEPCMDETLIEEEASDMEDSEDEFSCPESILFDSQSSIFANEHAEERLHDRKEAYAATTDPSGPGWFSLALISTGNGHSEQEVEL